MVRAFLDSLRRIDLPPINRANGNLVRSVFGGEDGHEEAYFRRTDIGILKEAAETMPNWRRLNA
jgi:hypothetical protein